jgi:hypothetical protein
MNRANYPNLFIVGAAKSGTTSLHHYLSHSPEIYFSPVKEPCYFGSDIDIEKFHVNVKRAAKQDLIDYYKKNRVLTDRHILYTQKMSDYLWLFSNIGDEKVIGEASTCYLYSKMAAAEIFEFNPLSKIIIILRNPVERALSHYFMRYNAGREKIGDPFKAIKNDMDKREKAWGAAGNYFELGLYFEQVQRYYEFFPKEQICILMMDDLKKDPSKLLGKVSSFLGVSDKFIRDVKLAKKNTPKKPRSHFLQIFSHNFLANRVIGLIPDTIKNELKNIWYKNDQNRYEHLSQNERKILKRLYHEDISKLEIMLNIDLTCWK